MVCQHGINTDECPTCIASRTRALENVLTRNGINNMNKSKLELEIIMKKIDIINAELETYVEEDRSVSNRYVFHRIEIMKKFIRDEGLKILPD